ncbi:hypothetical protein O181_027062 [Austropuccinia psidii MF-1]|uniref:Uncharacterized protein n=1 Tax=Austropuccinia psidii MF-1 TaxID=1389203 RepID=A0A9Q3H1C0_9BASI|nr:hypothetical protein [Austropuccinia psidii MF-1]
MCQVSRLLRMTTKSLKLRSQRQPEILHLLCVEANCTGSNLTQQKDCVSITSNASQKLYQTHKAKKMKSANQFVLWASLLLTFISLVVANCPAETPGCMGRGEKLITGEYVRTTCSHDECNTLVNAPEAQCTDCHKLGPMPTDCGQHGWFAPPPDAPRPLLGYPH